MLSDKLFFAIFQAAPNVVKELLQDLPGTADYGFSAPTIKAVECRLDGLFEPLHPADPWVFLEVQMHPDPDFYCRFFSEVFLYLRQNPPARHWRGLLLVARQGLNLGEETVALELLDHRVRRLYLKDLREVEGSAELALLQLIQAEPDQLSQLGQRVLNGPATLDYDQRLELVEAILASKLPALSTEELRQMLGIVTEDLKHTRFAQEMMDEGREEGRQKEMQAARHSELHMVLNFLRSKLGALEPGLVQGVEALTLEQIRRLGDDLLAFESVDDLAVWLERTQ